MENLRARCDGFLGFFDFRAEASPHRSSHPEMLGQRPGIDSLDPADVPFFQVIIQ